MYIPLLDTLLTNIIHLVKLRFPTTHDIIQFLFPVFQDPGYFRKTPVVLPSI